MAWPTACCASPSICWPGATSRWSSRPSHRPGCGRRNPSTATRCTGCPNAATGPSGSGLPAVTCQRWLAGCQADLVHLASPFVLGARGAVAAQRLGLPVLAVYQTDVPGYTRAYCGSRLAEAGWPPRSGSTCWPRCRSCPGSG